MAAWLPPNGRREARHCTGDRRRRTPFIDEHGRPHPWWRGGEEAPLLTFVDHHRATLAWKCRGLAEGLAAWTAASTMTLGGLLNHMAYIEDAWFSVVLHGAPRAAPWHEVDWKADRTGIGSPHRRHRRRSRGGGGSRHASVRDR